MSIVLKTVAEQLQIPIESLTNDSSPENLKNWDSLATIRIAMALEMSESISFTTEELVKFSSISAINEILSTKK